MATFTNGHTCFVICIVGFGLLVNVNSKEFFCNNRYIEGEDDVRIRCFYVSPEPATWHEARRYCHRNRGWLARQPSLDVFNEHPIGAELLAYNDVSSIWTGLHVKDNLLLEDDFPTPVSNGYLITNEPGEWIANVNYRGDCVIEEFYIPSCEEGGEEELDFPPETTYESDNVTGPIPANCNLENASYRKKFVSCDDKHIFGCYFSGVDLSQEMGAPTVLFSRMDEVPVLAYDPYFLPVQMFLTTEKSTQSKSDDVCSNVLERSTTFQPRWNNPIDTLNLVSQVLNTTGGVNESDYFNRQLHWIKENPNQCSATSLTFAYSQTNKKYSVMSWPCDASLPVVCQRDKVYTETTISLEAIISDSSLVLVGNEIQGPSIALLESLRNSESSGLSLNCSINSLKQGQTVTIYESGVVVDSYAPPISGATIPALKRKELNEPVEVMKYHYCQVNNEADNKLFESNRIFMRPTDLGVYSLHIDLFPNVSDIDVWTLRGYSVSNGWRQALGDFKADTVESEGSDGGNIFALLRSIENTPMSTLPVLFIQGDESRRHSLVFYLYEESSNIVDERRETASRRKRQVDIPPEEEEMINPNDFESMEELAHIALLETQRIIRDYLITRALSLRPLNTTTARLFSIDYCWEETVYEETTNRNYTLPLSKEGAVYKSPQTCAQGNTPLVTAECRGDKIVGLQWSPLQVNPLCDYSGTDEGDESEVTQTLQAISQENINSTNVDDYLNETKVLTSVLTDETVNTKDILYVADILQKSSEIDDLSPEAAKVLLDTVNIVTSLTPTTLTEAQEVGRATNRILESVDKLGGLVDIGDSNNFERIISGQYALEVWNLTYNYEDSPIIGLKVLNAGETEPIAMDDMISLFSENTDFDDTEAAIFLPKEFIMSILGSGSSNDIKLSMNVYRDTTLYTSSANNSNTTLNSRVIATQLLLNGQPITDLGAYNVTSVFKPNVELIDERRSELSVCVYWDFRADLGAGGWASDGCSYARTEDGKDVCVCNHLTSFAVLVNFYSQDSVADEHQLALSVITIVGLSLSILGLTISIISFLCIKKLRKGRPQQTLFNLALALLMTWIVFLAGIERTESHGGCIAVAAILHYLIMASFMWMLMEGLLQYLLFVRVMNTYFTNYMWKTGIPAWGLPIIPVVIVFAIDPELYDGGEEYCWMDVDAFYYAFALPVGLIVLINLVIFILVVVSLFKRRNMSKMSSQSKSQTVVNIRASFICFFVLGLSWVFGFLTIEEARTVFQYIFCILATLQGFIIFLMMTARDKTVQQFWRNLLCRCCPRGSKESTYRSSNDKGGSSQDTNAIPRLKRDRDGAYKGSGSSSNTMDTSKTNLSMTDSVKSRSEEISCDYESFAT